MLFNELCKLLRSGDTIALTIGLTEPGKFRLTVHPRLTGASAETGKLINQPFVIDGTPDEFDVELPKNLGGFATTVNSARTVFAELDERLKTAEKDKRGKIDAAKAAPKPAAPAKPANPTSAALDALSKVAKTEAPDVQPELL